MGGWAWKKVIQLLEQGRHEAHAVTLTGMGERVHLASKDVGIETAIQDVLNVIKYNDLDDFVLIGHSFAGKVVAAVADRVPERVKMILYLDAFRPEKNVRTPQGSFDPNEFGNLKPGEWTISLTEEILDNIGKDVQGADREWMLSMATPWPMKHSSEPVTLSRNFDTVKQRLHILHRRRRPRRRNPERKVGKARRSLQGHRIRALADDNEARRAGQRHAQLVRLDQSSNTRKYLTSIIRAVLPLPRR